jgi:hypothetical protein
MSPEDVSQVAARSDLCVMGLRFSGDWISPGARFESLTKLFGDRFRAVTIPTGEGTPFPKQMHPVLTQDPAAWTGNRPAMDELNRALDQVLSFLRERLGTATP